VEQPAAHPDLAVDAPDGEVESLLAQRDVPSAHVVADTVDQNSVEIEEEGNRTAI
jgi:hypothetical protein